ncbi:Tetratricopeptide-like helical [Paramyrothecium foliicola]|nr:Tetratricopeptide-like helical [Paramyrothecium foliicola]
MAPTPAGVGVMLRQVIYYHLDNSSYDNALFFAERFVAHDPKSTDAAYLYALCHFRLRDFRSAYDVSKPLGYRGTHIGCAWVFAQACLALERYKDGISALEKSRGLWSQENSLGKHSANSRTGGPDASAVLCLLGKLYRAFDDKKKAINSFEEALKLNPFTWDAFTALCDMGVNVRVPNIFRSSETLIQSFNGDMAQAITDLKENGSNPPDPLSKKALLRQPTTDLGIDPFSVNLPNKDVDETVMDVMVDVNEGDLMSKVQAARLRLASSINSQPGSDGQETPTGAIPTNAMAPRAPHPQDPPQAPPRKVRNLQSMDTGLEAPPRMNYRLGTRKNLRTQEKTQGADSPVEIMSEASNATSGAARSSAPAVERKRTVSGHPVPRSTNTEEPTARRSARLNMFKPSLSKANSGAATIGPSTGRELKKARPQISRIIRPGSSGSNVGRVVSGNRKPVEGVNGDVDHGEIARIKEPSIQPTATKSVEVNMARLEETLKWTLDLLKKLGNGYYQLSRYQCQESLQSFSAVPPSQQNTPWVLAQMGRAHYERASYAEAEKFFRKMRVQAPSRLEDMEVYSTVLWHLKRATDLSFLAHELVDAAWHSPQAWCALGNAWSLARDHEQALRCFKRATQLDPTFAYAFTLQGHEHVTNEEYEKALTAYRQAISADRRHYNAYYGIGRVQERLGAYEKAYTHFHAARCINPNNAVLICCIGAVLEKQKQIMPALQAYSKAVELAPKAAQTRYKKARALLAVGQVEAAQRELMILKDLAPDEGTVHFLLGTLYRSMNERQLAVRHFTIALALDPKVLAKLPLTCAHVAQYANQRLGRAQDQGRN